MADQFTTRIGIRQIETGTRNNTWGDTLNSDGLQVIDDAIAKQTTLSGLTGGTYALDASEERAPIIICQGTLAANQVLEVAAVQKHWWVKNDTTGNFTLSVRVDGGGGDAVAVTQGEWALLYSDGTDVVELQIPPMEHSHTESFLVACSDLVTDISTGTGKAYFRMPYAFQITEIMASLKTASSSGAVTVDVNKNGSTIMATPVSIDAGEKTTTTAATPNAIGNGTTAKDDEISFDIDGAGTGARGLIVALIGHRILS